MQELYRQTPTPIQLRSRADITRLFAGFELVEPGVVYLPEWQPEYPEDAEEDPRWVSGFCGIGLLG